MCIKCLIMQLRCIFFALCRRGAREDEPTEGKVSRGCVDARRSGLRRENGRPAAPGNGLYPDISQQSFHNSSILRGVPSLN
ncbi:Uncharacterised protein [Raoultella terrigena]|uniref:Uncharacterized protein n=1 Tax=Raoultella terrigena TaxID=577 RepID=A0A4U9CZM1_RAOTE|nr:Uncharacterised protein [Raoultella terrigena]